MIETEFGRQLVAALVLAAFLGLAIYLAGRTPDGDRR